MPGEENVYEPTALGDAVNELSKIWVHEDGTIEDLGGALVTLEERYAKYAEREGNEKIIALINAHPEKVQRTNEIAAKINENMSGVQDILLHKRLANEYVRLLQGKGNHMFPEPEADPDLLEG